MKFSSVIALVIALMAVSTVHGAEEWSLSWCELGPVAQGKKVRLFLADGERVRGHSVAVSKDSIRFLVVSSSNEERYPRGESTLFARDSIEQIRIIGQGHKGKVIGTVAGVVGGLFVGYGAAYASGSWGALLGTWAGVSIGGYAAGAAADRSPKHVRLKPGNQACPEPPELTENRPASTEAASPPLTGLAGIPTYGQTKGVPADADLNSGDTGQRWRDWQLGGGPVSAGGGVR